KNDFLKGIDRAARMKTVLASFEKKLKIYFGDKLFNSPEFVKNVTNKISQAVFLSLIICCKENYKMNALKDHEIRPLGKLILDVAKSCIVKDLASNTNAKCLERVQTEFQKHMKLIKDDSEEEDKQQSKEKE